MIIKSCYIENFGTFHDQTFQFEDGVNVMKQKNGWGKSTLAVFIKSMFYGMEYSRKRKQITEYKKYEPWQGGRYGGNLIFTVSGKEYKVIRYFGKKESEGIFELYDTLTNKLTDDYSTNLGEELFGIDCASFERSIFVKLDSEQKNPELSDSISAKLNNLVDNTDDINNFETAYARLDKLAASVVPKRGSNGMIGDVEEQVRKINDALLTCDNAEREMEILRSQITCKAEERKRLESEKKQFSENLETFRLAEKKEQYEKLAEIEKRTSEKCENLAEFFRHGVPSEAEIALHIKEANDIAVYCSKLAEIERIEEKKKNLVDIERFFAGHVPTEEQIKKCRSDIAAYNREREKLIGCKPTEDDIAKYHTLREKFGSQSLTEEQFDACMADYERMMRLTSEIAEKNVKFSESQAKHTASRQGLVGIIAFAVLVIIGGAAVAVTESLFIKITSVVCALVGIVGLCMLLAKRKKTPPEDIAAAEEMQCMQRERDIAQRSFEESAAVIAPNVDTDNLMAELNRIRIIWNEMQTLADKIRCYDAAVQNSEVSVYQREIENFLNQYASVDSTADDMRKLSVVEQNLNTFTYLVRETGMYDKIKADEDAAKKRLLPFLERYSAAGQTYFEKMQDIRDRQKEFGEAEEQRKQAKAELLDFAGKNDVDTLKNVILPDLSKNEIEKTIQDYNDKISACTSEIAKAERDMERQSAIADTRQENESERIRLTERKEYLSDKHAVLKDTMDLLERAKENLTSKYMNDMTPAFNKYLNMIDPDQMDIVLTSELDTQILHNGRQWESGYHSRGYTDMVNVCTRLALADVMYREEKPFLIFDDPFVNLDDEKTERALEFLKQLGAQKQIFYFTCHKSRNVI